MRLLLIEDDTRLIQHLEERLSEQGFLVQSVGNSHELSEVMKQKQSQRFDMIVMDRLLGTFDAKSFLPEMKAAWAEVPVIILSAISTPNERTDLINMGADDYLGKPFSSEELIARIRSLLRRNKAPTSNYLQVGNLVVDIVRRVVSVEGSAENLPSREFALLRTLAADPSRVWSKEELLDYVWGQSAMVETNVVESTITNLRKKLANLKADVTIRNMRNAGYWLAA